MRVWVLNALNGGSDAPVHLPILDSPEPSHTQNKYVDEGSDQNLDV